MQLPESDAEQALIEADCAKAGQHGAGAASAPPEAIDKSRAGLGSKIHLAVYLCARLAVAFEVIVAGKGQAGLDRGGITTDIY